MSGTVSVASFGSSTGSQSSKRSSKYRTVNTKSVIDESLFGPLTRHSSAPRERESPITENTNTARANSAPKKSNDVEVIQVITKDMIRKLRVPRDDPSGQSLVLSSREFGRIRNSSRVLTKQEREALQERRKQEKAMQVEQAEERKLQMQKLEALRQKNEKLSDLEQEAKEKSQYLLQNAEEQMEEHIDEIKKLNEIILNAKCHAIRDAQLIEKAEIKKEMLEEEKRLDEMMEGDRVQALVEYEYRENAKKQERLKGARILHQQIDENVQHNLLEQEKKDQETKAMLQYLDKLKQEDMEALLKKRDTQRAIMKDVAKANEDIGKMKDLQKEREKMEEIKVMEYLNEKAAREEAYEKERELARIEKEKDIARLRALQERAKDKQAEKDALRAKRNQEEAEREWRRKELQEAKEKAETEKHLREARQEQIANKDHFLAVQAARDRAEFERVLNAQKEQAFKDDLADQDFHHKRESYANDVRQQIRVKERERINARQAFFEEGIQLDQEAKDRRQKLDEIKRRKLKELKNAGVPDKYVHEVARRVEANPQALAS